MRHVSKAEVARLRFVVVNCRTGALVAAFPDCAAACAMRDAGPRNSQGLPLLEVGELDASPPTKPRLRVRRRKEPRQSRPLADLVDQPPEPLDRFNYFQRSA